MTSSFNKSDEADLTLATEWKRFAESTSIKTLPKALRSKTGCLRFVWLFALLFGVGVAAFQLYDILSTYLLYKTTLNIRELNEAPPFPDITICKMNPPPTFESSVVEKFVHDVDAEINDYDDKEYWNEENNRDTLNLVEDLGSLSGYFQTVNSSTIQIRNVYDFVIQCSYTTWNSVRENCSIRRDAKSWFLTPEYPTCITIKINETERDDIMGFTGIFYLDDFDTLDAPNFEISLLNSQARGVKVFLSDAEMYPSILLGAPVSSGTQGNIRVSSILLKRLKEPYGECREGEHGYSKTQCEYNCKQDYMIRNCKCLDPDTPTTLEQRSENIYCGALEDWGRNISETLTRMNCRKNKLRELHDNCSNSCLPPCKETSFTYQKLDAAWPHESRHLSLYRDYIRSNGRILRKFEEYYEHAQELLNNDSLEEAFEMLRQSDLIRRNFLQINIHFDDRKVTLYEDTEFMTAASLFAQIGGILNLWIGITFVTLVEIGEFLYHSSVVVAYKAKVRSDKVQSLSEEKNTSQTNNDIFTNNEKTDFGNMDKTKFSDTSPKS